LLISTAISECDDHDDHDVTLACCE
jgi:hypothetical protein